MAKKEILRSRLVALRTSPQAVEPSTVCAWIRENYPETAILWARHDPPDGETHHHFVLRFPSVEVWNPLRDWLQSPEVDPHSNSRPARSFVRASRYLLHLDNPEKHPVPRENLSFEGIDPDEVAEVMGGERAPILAAIVECADLSPVDAFEFLVTQRGFKPSECSSAIRLLYELERLKRLRSGLGSRNSSKVEDVLRPAPEFGPGAFLQRVDPLSEEWDNPAWEQPSLGL